MARTARFSRSPSAAMISVPPPPPPRPPAEGPLRMQWVEQRRDNKLGGVEGSKTPVLAHFDPPHEPHASAVSTVFA